MSIASEITRITTAKSAIRSAIGAKGVNIASSVTLDGYPYYISLIPTGSEPEEATYEPLDDVVYIDYDGTIVATYSKTEFLALTEHPSNPDRTGEGLTAQGWNWSFADAQAYVTANGALVIGQQYTTTDGKTRFRIDTRLAPGMFTTEFAIQLRQTKAQGVLIEWGDGTSERFASTTPNTPVTHTYAQDGEYTITLTPNDDCTLSPYGGSGYSSLFGYAYSSPDKYARCGAIKEIHYGKNVTEVGLSFNTRLEKVSIPSSVTKVIATHSLYCIKSLVCPQNMITTSAGPFNGMNTATFISFNKTMTINNMNISSPSLRMITLPAITGTLTAQGMFSLERLVFPTSITALTLHSSPYIDRLVLPEGVTSIGNSAFNPHAFKTIDLPSTITTIGTNAFFNRYMTTLESINVRATTPPTIQSTTFAYTNDCTIYVPQGTLSSYQGANYWSAIASRIVESPDF